MKILLTGATGYIGKRLLPELVKLGHVITCSVRDRNRFQVESQWQSVQVVETDFILEIPAYNQSFDVAFYLIHSMSTSSDFAEMERTSAKNFRLAMEQSGVKQVIYLSGIGK